MKGKNVAALIVCITCSGCSLLAPHTQEVSARCSEADAQLFINESKFQGFGSANVKRNRSVSVMCIKEGFKPATTTVEPTLSTSGIVDAIGTSVILIPGVGFLSPGAWRIKEDNINVSMERFPVNLQAPGH